MNEYLTLFLINVFMIFLMGTLFAAMPYFVRKSFLFGVKIPIKESNTKTIVILRRRYSSCITMITFLMFAVALMQHLIAPQMTILFMLYMPLLFILLVFLVYYPCWRAAMKLKEINGWKVNNVQYAETHSANARGDLRHLPAFWYVLSLVIVVASAAITLHFYPQLPNQLPVHWSIDGTVNRYVEKNMLNVLMMPLMNLGMIIIFFITGIGIEKSKLQIDAEQPARSFAQHRVYRKRYGHMIGALTLFVALMFAVLGFRTIFPESAFFASDIVLWGFIGVSVLVLPIVIVVIVMRTGQGGCKVKIDADTFAAEDVNITMVSGRGDDKFWKLGLFYVNKGDAAYIVEDRFGSNIGFNFAKPIVQLGTILLITGLIALYVWMTMMFI